MVVIFEVEKDWVQLYDSHSTPTEYLPEQTAVTMCVKSKESSDNIITWADVQTPFQLQSDTLNHHYP